MSPGNAGTSRCAIVVALILGAGSAGCASIPDPSRYTVIGEPDVTEFSLPLAPSSTPNTGSGGVHLFLENQCGTLDCHGQVGRPFRIFSQNGLRLANDGGLLAGSGATSQAEINANYLSAIGLEPEEMSAVVSGAAPPTALLLVKKPRGLEHHKGGTRIVEGDPSDLCLTGWLGAPSRITQFDPNECYLAGLIPY
jgi:hypothetical protein